MTRVPTSLLPFVLALVVAIGTAALAAPKHELSVAAGIDSAYDDNVYNGRGPDFVNRINPQGSYHLIDPRYQVDAAYLFGYWTYALGKASNSLNHRASVGVEGRPHRRVVMRLNDEFTRAEDPGFLTRIGVVAPQIGIIDNIADASIGVNLTRRWFGAAGYTFHMATFDPYTPTMVMQGLPALYDGAEHDALLNFSYRVTRSDDFRFGTRVQHFSAGPQNGSITAWDLANTYAPSVGWRHQFLRELDLTADVGPVVYQALSGAEMIPAAPHDNGVTWRLGSRLRWYTPTWRASLSYMHDLLGATGAGTAIWADYLYGQAGFHWLEKLDVSAGAGYFRNGFAVNQAFAYDGVTVDALVDWRIINNLRLGAYYTLRWQRTGPGAIPPGAPAAQFPNVTRDIVGLRLLAVIGADARPPRREVKE
jgi:hypothetical protein